VSSRCAAASSTSSRRPRSTRCGWSSGATRSRRSAGSRSPTSARSGAPSTGCGRRRAASCCSPTPCASGRRAGRPAARRRRDAAEARPRHRRRGHGVARAGPRRRHGDAARRAAPGVAARGLADPERVRTRAHDLVSTSQEFLEAGWANAASGNAVPVDLQSVLGTASYGPWQAREQARDLGLPWWARPHPGRSPATSEFGDVLDLARSPASRATFRGDTDEGRADLRALVADGWRSSSPPRGRAWPSGSPRCCRARRARRASVRAVTPTWRSRHPAS
jgi:hypothetical protein